MYQELSLGLEFLREGSQIVVENRNPILSADIFVDACVCVCVCMSFVSLQTGDECQSVVYSRQEGQSQQSLHQIPHDVVVLPNYVCHSAEKSPQHRV